MQIVIDVPQKLVYEGFERPFTEEEKNFLIKAIGKGTPLPRRHGRLIDADKVINDGFDKGFCDWYDELKYADTIIEADRSEET